jgi:hypothetical protein
MEIIAPSIVKEKLDQKARGEFTDYIQQLPAGGALKIHPSQWKRREQISHFFNVRYKGLVSVRLLNDGYYYIIKL